MVKSRFRVLVTLEAKYRKENKQGDFVELVGFDKKTTTSIEYGTEVSNITRSVESLFIHSNVLKDSIVSGRASDKLYRFSVDGYQLSYPFQVEPKRSLFNKISSASIKEMRIYITDDKNRIVNLNDVLVNTNVILKM